MGLFGKKEDKIKEKTPEQIKKEKAEFDKNQIELLVALRTTAELKIEKSAIVTLGQMSDVVRSQTLINKNLQTEINNKSLKFVEYNKDLSKILRQTYDNVDSMKAHLKSVIDDYSK